jgi:myosin-3
MSLFFSTPIGLFALMDEETRFPNASDQTLTEKIRHHLQSHPNFVVPQGQSGFVIKHYAGDIEYSTTGWLERNRDSLTPSITSLFRNSKLRLVAELFSLSQTATGGLTETMDKSKLLDRQSNARALIRTLRTSVWVNPKKSRPDSRLFMEEDTDGGGEDGAGDGGRGGKRRGGGGVGKIPTGEGGGIKRRIPSKKINLSKTQRNANLATLAGHFKASLTDLMRTIDGCNPHFIRCIRPNKSGTARAFDDNVSVHFRVPMLLC